MRDMGEKASLVTSKSILGRAHTSVSAVCPPALKVRAEPRRPDLLEILVTNLKLCHEGSL